jgi:hypothetical protein
MFYRCQRFTSNQYKVKRKGSKDRSKGNRSAPWSGAPDCPVCHQTVSGAPPNSVRCTREDRPQTLQLRVSQVQLCYNSPDCPVCQQSNDYLRATVDSDSEQCSTVNTAEVRTVGQRGHRTVRCSTGLFGAT